MDDGCKTKNVFLGSVISLGLVECIALTALWAVFETGCSVEEQNNEDETGNRKLERQIENRKSLLQ